MFGISLPELLVVAVIALLVFGPDKLPQMASQIGKITFQLKKTSDAFRREFYNSVYKPSEEQTINLKTELKALSDQAVEIQVAPEAQSSSSDLNSADQKK